jgi:hypothetical protein
MVSKFFCDSLVDMGFIPDDSKKVIREVKLVVDEDIEKNTAIAKAYLR